MVEGVEGGVRGGEGGVKGGVGLDYGVGASLGPVCGVGGTRVGHQGCGWGGRGYGVKVGK